MHGKPNFKPTASPTSYTGSKPTDSQKKKKKKKKKKPYYRSLRSETSNQ